MAPPPPPEPTLAAERMGQPCRMINELRPSAAFGTQRLAGRVARVGFEAGETAVFDHDDAATSGNAQPAIAVNAVRAGGIEHGVLPLSSNARLIRIPQALALIVAQNNTRDHYAVNNS